MTRINKVLLSAGIHGNEKTGIYLIEKFQANRQLVSRDNFTTETLLINTKAIALNRRYYEVDLNRCFALEEIDSSSHKYYEQSLAREIYCRVKEASFDFILDFHTSTSNMGLTLLLSNDNPFNLQLAAYLAATDPLIKIVRTDNTRDKNRFRHLFPFGFTVEMGAVAPNVIDPLWFERGERLVKRVLDYLEQTNRQRQPQSPENITVYSLFDTIYFPVDSSGKTAGMVHPKLHGNDYCALKPGEPILLKFDGEAIIYQGENTVYPIFVNEAAYWENQIAMYLTNRENQQYPPSSTNFFN